MHWFDGANKDSVWTVLQITISQKLVRDPHRCYKQVFSGAMIDNQSSVIESFVASKPYIAKRGKRGLEKAF